MSANDLWVMRIISDERGFMMIRGDAPHEENLLTIARYFGEPMVHDGKRSSEIFDKKEAGSSIADTRGAVPWHTERIYTPYPPAGIVLGCEEPPATGGRTLLLEGELAANTLLKEYRRLHEVVFRYTKGIQRGTWPLILHDPVGGNHILSYRQGDHQHIELVNGPPGVGKEDILELIDDVLGSLQPTYAHEWQKNDILVIDNYSMLHAREAYTGDRKLRRVFIS